MEVPDSTTHFPPDIVLQIPSSRAVVPSAYPQGRSSTSDPVECRGT